MGRLSFLLACWVVVGHSANPAVADAPTPQKSEKTVAVPEGVAYLPDVTYCTFDDQTTLEMDVAFPSRGRGPLPALVFIHGGGWVTGDRKNITPYLMTAARAGYVAVAISYRLAPKHPYPAALQDAKCAVRFLRANADKYKIDPEHIGALGFSAGGNLACMLGSTGDKEFAVSGDNAKESDRVQAVASFYGIADLAEWHQSCGRKEVTGYMAWGVSIALKSYLETSDLEKDKGRCADASPIGRVGKDTPPTFLAHGTKDTLVPVAQSQSYAKKLKEGGAEVTLVEVPGEGHNFVGEAEQKAMQAALEFLDKRLKRESVADAARGK
jgi:acetyl esterase/lipase